MSKRQTYRCDGPLESRGSCPTPGKRGYYMRSSAKKALRLASGHKGDWRKESRVYPCACGLWHLTSMHSETVTVPTSAPLPDGLRPRVVQ